MQPGVTTSWCNQGSWAPHGLVPFIRMPIKASWVRIMSLIKDGAAMQALIRIAISSLALEAALGKVPQSVAQYGFQRLPLRSSHASGPGSVFVLFFSLQLLLYCTPGSLNGLVCISKLPLFILKRARAHLHTETERHHEQSAAGIQWGATSAPAGIQP
jgi:hypothetical protein